MKYTIYTILPLAGLLLFSCGGERGEPYEYIAELHKASDEAVAEAAESMTEPVEVPEIEIPRAVAPSGIDATDDSEVFMDSSLVEKTFEDWTFVQNSGDFSAYSSFYAEDFTGVKRSGSFEYFYDRTGWLADRRAMFDEGFSICTENMRVKPSGSAWIVTFTQDWKSSTYHDRGEKKLFFEPHGGDYRIVREEMVNSTIILSDL